VFHVYEIEETKRSEEIMSFSTNEEKKPTLLSMVKNRNIKIIDDSDERI